MWRAPFLDLLLLPLLCVVPVGALGREAQVQVVWTQEGAAAQLPCSSTTPLQDLNLLRIREVLWQHLPDSGPPGASQSHPAASSGPAPAAPVPRGHIVLRVTPGGLRSGKQPLQPRVQLQERGLQRGDFSLWLRPVRRADAGEYRASVSLRDRDRHRRVACRLRLRVGQASLTVTSPAAGTLRASDWVVLNCSFSRPDRPASVHWFRGAGRVPVQASQHLHFAGSFLFLPQVRLSDAGLWGCLLAYRDGFNVSITHSLTVADLVPSVPRAVYAAEGTRVELPCHLPPGVKTQSPLTAQWVLPGGGPDLLVAGNKGNVSLHLDAVSRTQAGTYTCHVRVQRQWLNATVTLAVITGGPEHHRGALLSTGPVTPKSSGPPGSESQPLCEVTPASGQERFVWSPLGGQSGGSSPGPWLPVQDTRQLSQPWQCQLYQGDMLLGTAFYFTGLSGPGAWTSGGAPGTLKAAHLPLFLILGILFLLLLGTGAYGFHLWRRQTISQWRHRRFSALEQGVRPPEAQRKREELEQEQPELELGPEPTPEPELELEPRLEPEPETELWPELK